MNSTMPLAGGPAIASRSLPPGPGFLPTLRWFRRMPGGTLGTFEHWARRYGDVCRYRTPVGPVCVLSAPREVEQVLVTQSRLFVKGRGSQLNRRLLGNGLLTSEGAAWMHQRRLMQPAFHPARLDRYAEAVTGYTAKLLAGWQGRGRARPSPLDDPIDARDRAQDSVSHRDFGLLPGA